MPLYSDSNYYYGGGSSQLFSPYYTGSSASSMYSPYSSSTSYNRPYTGSYIIPLTSSRSNNYAGHGGHSALGGHGGHSLSSLRYQPKLSTITESSPIMSSTAAAASLHSNLMPLTRIQSPKYNPYSTHNPVHTSKYVPPRPILINTADIDVTANRYRKRKQQADFEERQRQRTLESFSPRTSIKMETNTNNVELDKKPPPSNLNEIDSIGEQHRGRSTIRRNRTVVRLSTMRSRNKGPNTIIMNEADNFPTSNLQKDEESVENIKKDMNDGLLVPPEINVEPIITFHDICEDISSDKIDDDLNAGELRRRASLICLQDQELLNQLQILKRRNSHEPIEDSNETKLREENFESTSSNVISPNPRFNEQNFCEIHDTVKLPKKKKKSINKSNNKNKDKGLLSVDGKKKFSPNKKLAPKKDIYPEVFKFDAKSIKELNKASEKEEKMTCIELHKEEPAKPELSKEKSSSSEIENEISTNSMENISLESSVKNIKTSNINNVETPLILPANDKKVSKKTSKWSSSVDLPSSTLSHKVLEKSQSLTGPEPITPTVATPKSIRKKPLKKTDNDNDKDGEDFWAQIGTRETVYIANRRKDILQNYSSKSDLSETAMATSSNDLENKSKLPIIADVDLRKNLLEKNVQKKLFNRANSETICSNQSTTSKEQKPLTLRDTTGPSKAASKEDKTKSQSEPPSKVSSPTLVAKISNSPSHLQETEKTPTLLEKPVPIKPTKDDLTSNNNNNTKRSVEISAVQKDAPLTKNVHTQLKTELKDKLDNINMPANAQMPLDLHLSKNSMPEEATATPSKITGHLAKSPEQNQEACKQDSKCTTIETASTNNKKVYNNNNNNKSNNKCETTTTNANSTKYTVENQQKKTTTVNEVKEGKLAAATTAMNAATTKQPETLQLTTQLLESTDSESHKTKTSDNDIPKTIATTTAAASTTTAKGKSKPNQTKNASPLKAKAKTSPSLINAEQFISNAPNKVALSPTKSLTVSTPTTTTSTTTTATSTSTIEKVNRKSTDKQIKDQTSSVPDKVKTAQTAATTSVITAAAISTPTPTTAIIACTSSTITTTTKISAETTCENKSGIRDISRTSGDNNSNNNLSKFATVSNLAQCLRDVDADLDDYVPSCEEFSDNDDDNNNSDLDLSSIDGWDNFSVSMKKKLRHQRKKAKQLAEQQAGFDPQKKVKIDTTRKLYVKDEAPRYPLVATPRPLWKREKIVYNDDANSDDSDNDSDGSTEETDTSDECNTSEEYDDEQLGSNIHNNNNNNNNNKNDSGIIRMSTSSNDSGFEGGTAPTSPKRMLECDVNCHKKCERLTANLCGVNQKLIVEALASVKRGGRDTRDSPSTPPSLNPAYKIESIEEQNEQDETSYTYAEFQKSGRFTTPATVIPRFKNYCVDDFHFLAVLGKGSFGKVLLAELRDTTYYYAIKCLKKDVVLEDDDVDSTLIERKVLALGTNHPYLCHLFCTFQTESHLFFVMEYLNGGDLMFHIQESGRFPEERARFYGAEIISGLKFLHKKGIIYRDLKLDNVLLDYEGHVRIADFGMCKLQIYLDKTADSFCGTPDYMAPEIIKGENYNQNVDWWSFGVLLYEMLIGQSPFSGCDEDELFWSICNEIPWFPVYITTEATSILKGLLEKDHNKRIGSHYSLGGDICHHVFFRPIDWELLEKRLIPPPFRPQVKHPLDTQYFDRVFTRERVRLTPIDKDILQSMDQKQFLGFTYTNPHITLD